jgi:hypothetical protein
VGWVGRNIGGEKRKYHGGSVNDKIFTLQGVINKNLAWGYLNSSILQVVNDYLPFKEILVKKFLSNNN